MGQVCCSHTSIFSHHLTHFVQKPSVLPEASNFCHSIPHDRYILRGSPTCAGWWLIHDDIAFDNEYRSSLYHHDECIQADRKYHGYLHGNISGTRGHCCWNHCRRQSTCHGAMSQPRISHSAPGAVCRRHPGRRILAGFELGATCSRCGRQHLQSSAVDQQSWLQRF